MKNLLRVRFVRDVALTGGTQFLQAASAMAAGILVARALGPSGRGLLSVLVALGSMAILLASLGLQHSGVYFLGRFKSERDAVLSNNVAVGVVGGVATAVVLSLVALTFRHQLLADVSLGIFFLYVGAIPFAYFGLFARASILGAGRVAAFNFPAAVEGAALFFGTAAALAVFGNRLGPLVAVRVAVEVATALLLVLYIRRALRFRFRPSRTLLRRQFAYGLRNYASSLLWIFLLQSDLVLCNYFLGSGQTGVYSVAVSLGLPITMLASVVGTLTFQRVSADESRASRIANTNRAVRVLAPITALAVMVLGATAEVIVPAIYGREFSDASTALVLLLPGLFAFSVEIVLINFLAGEGSPPIVYRAPFVGLAMNVLANLWVIPRWGIDGAAATSSLAYSIVLALVLRHYLRSTQSSLTDIVLPSMQDVRVLVGLRSNNFQTQGDVAPAPALSIHRMGGLS